MLEKCRPKRANTWAGWWDFQTVDKKYIIIYFFSSKISRRLPLTLPFSTSTYHRDDGQYYYYLPILVLTHIIYNMYMDYGRKTEDTIADPKCILQRRPRRPHRPNTEKYVYRARRCRRKRAGGDVAVCCAHERGEPTGRRRRCCSARQRRQPARASRDDDDDHFITAATAPEVVASSVPETISCESFHPLLFYVFMYNIF